MDCVSSTWGGLEWISGSVNSISNISAHSKINIRSEKIRIKEALDKRQGNPWPRTPNQINFHTWPMGCLIRFGFLSRFHFSFFLLEEWMFLTWLNVSNKSTVKLNFAALQIQRGAHVKEELMSGLKKRFIDLITWWTNVPADCRSLSEQRR